MSKKVLITSGSGFIGSHMLEHLLKNTDWELTTIDRLSKSTNKGFDRMRDIKAYDNERVNHLTFDLNQPIGEGLRKEIGAVDIILHIAANSHVDTSISDPVPFVTNNVNSTLMMMEFARTLPNLEKFLYFSTDEVYGTAPKGVDYKEGDRHNPGNPYSASKSGSESIVRSYANTYNIPCIITNCWDMATKVLTEKGSKSYEELKEGDLVWTLDKEENLILEPVQQKIKMKGSEVMYKFTTNTMSQLVTPNHRMMFKKPTGKPRKWGEIEEAHAEKLYDQPNRIRIPLTGKWNGNDDNYPTGWDKEWLAKALGWYISEGYEANGNGVCFGAGTEKQFQELEELFKDFNTYRDGRSLRFHDKELKKVLQQCGKLAKNKKVPSFVLQGTKKTLKPFWECAMKGDGANLGLKGQEVYYTSSKQSVKDFREVGMKLGYGIRISERETWNPTKTKKGKSYIVRFHKGFTDLERRNIKQESYDSDVWCISVPSGRVFIEREGAICLTGQTMNVLGERQHPEKYLPLVINKVLAGEKVLIHADKTCTNAGTRFYIHARNVADGVLHILQNVDETLDNIDASKGVFNIVGEKEMDNLQLARLIAQYVKQHSGLDKSLIYELVDFHSSRPGHDLRYSLNGDKMATLGWKPPITIEESISKIIEWTLKEENLKWLKVE